MPGLDRSPASHRWLALFRSAAVIALPALALACSGDSSPQDQNAPISIQTSQLSVVVENKVGMPVTEVEVSIIPLGGSTAFKKFIGRMESAEKRDLALNDFFGNDGTTFSLRLVRPKSVRVTGKDLNNKEVNVEQPWK